MSFFGFGPKATISIALDGADDESRPKKIFKKQTNKGAKEYQLPIYQVKSVRTCRASQIASFPSHYLLAELR